MSLRPVIWTVAALAAACFALAQSPADPDAVPLFNGKDLTGLYTFLPSKGVNSDPDHVFKVEDGALHISGQEFGFACTEKEYENYRLTAEFKWGTETWKPRKDRARDSGILFHYVGPDKVWGKSIEFQMIEGGTGDILVVDGGSMDFDPAKKAQLAGKLSEDGKRLVGHASRLNWWGRSPEWKDVAGIRGKDDLEKPLGEWNQVELIADGDTIKYYLNGKLANEGTGVEPHKGKILFQSEGAEVYFRNMVVHPLKK